MLLHNALTLVHIIAAAPAVDADQSPAVESRQPEATSSAEEMRGAAAKQLYGEQHYVESARAYEALYGEFGGPKYLFNAAAAHEGAGQDAHAYVALRRFLDHPGLSAEDQARGETRLAPLRRRTVALQLELAPSPRPAGLELELRRPGVDVLRLDVAALAALDRRGVIEVQAEQGAWTVQARAPGYHTKEISLQPSAGATKALLELEPVATEAAAAMVAVTATFEPAQVVAVGIDVELEGAKPQYKRVQSSPTTWQLAPGKWTLTATSPGYRPARVAFTADTQAAPLNVRLEPVLRVRPTTIVLGALGGTGFVAGAIATSVYASSFKNELSTYTSKIAPKDGGKETSPIAGASPLGLMGPVESARRGHQWGTAVLGAGLGLGFGALLKASEHRLRKPGRAWTAGLLGGGGLAALGFGLWTLSRNTFVATMESSYCSSPVINSEIFCKKFEGTDGVQHLPTDSPPSMQILHRGGLASLVGGLGIGLAASGLVGLVQMALKKRKVNTHARLSAPGGSSLMISF